VSSLEKENTPHLGRYERCTESTGAIGPYGASLTTDAVVRISHISSGVFDEKPPRPECVDKDE